jgi:hypothetical protein
MPKKVDKYENEQKEIVDRILNILDINDDNNKFYLHDLDNSHEKQEQIMNIIPDIKKYFICSNWSCLAKDNIKRPWLSLMKYIFKTMNYNLISSRVSIKNNENKFMNVTLYYLIKK